MECEIWAIAGEKRKMLNVLKVEEE